MAPRLSVVVATRDRNDDLARCLASLVEVVADPAQFEVLVVDNGSQPGAEEVVRRAEGSALPDLRIVDEPRPGLSGARNTGARSARGEIVVYLDDDATAAPELVDAYLDAFDDDRILAAGGPVRPVWPDGAPPSWLPGSGDGYFSLVDHGPSPRPLLYPEPIVGANMAFRRSILLDHPFDTRLGRRRRSLLSGEDSRAFLALARRGGRVAWVPDAAVHHHLGRARVTVRWLLRRAYGQGRTEVRFARFRSEVLGASPRDDIPRLGDELRAVALDGWRRTFSPRRRARVSVRATDDLVRRSRHLGRAAEVTFDATVGRLRPDQGEPAPPARTELFIAATLVTRDEIDIVGDHIAYHLDLGVDLLLVTDHRSGAETRNVLAEAEREHPDRVLVVREEAVAFEQARWVTRMARHAAARGADWLVHLDTDEFLVTDGTPLRAILSEVPGSVGALRLDRLNVVLRESGPQPWFERMVARECTSRSHNGVPSPSKIAHRASLAAQVTAGNHAVRGQGLGDVRPADGLALLHFPYRDPDQVVRKLTVGAAAVRALTDRGKAGEHWIEQCERLDREGTDVVVGEWLHTEQDVQDGLDGGWLVTDTRVRDALRTRSR